MQIYKASRTNKSCISLRGQAFSGRDGNEHRIRNRQPPRPMKTVGQFFVCGRQDPLVRILIVGLTQVSFLI